MYNIAKTARSCRFALHNIRKIRPFLTQHAAQLLVQALVTSRLDYCNALLAGLPSNTIKPSANPKGPMSHLSLSPCTGSSSRHWCMHIEQPQAQHPPTSTHWWQSTSPPEAWVPENVKVTPENSSLLSSLDFCFFIFLKKKKKKKKNNTLTSPCLACFCSEQCLKCCITSTSCDCLPLYNVLHIVFINCKSLWIKASAKLIHVNVNEDR